MCRRGEDRSAVIFLSGERARVRLFAELGARWGARRGGSRDGGSRRQDRRQGAGGGGEDERAAGRRIPSPGHAGGGLEQAAQPRGTRGVGSHRAHDAPGHSCVQRRTCVHVETQRGERRAGSSERQGCARRGASPGHPRGVSRAGSRRRGEETKTTGRIQVGAHASRGRRGSQERPPVGVQNTHRRPQHHDGEPGAHRQTAATARGAIPEPTPRVRQIHRPTSQHPRTTRLRRLGHRTARSRGQGARDGPAV